MFLKSEIVSNIIKLRSIRMSSEDVLLKNFTVQGGLNMSELSIFGETISTTPMGPRGLSQPASPSALVLLSLLFCFIGIIGLVGNSLIIIVILVDKKMRNSVTNIVIFNLAVSDFLILAFGVPEIVQFMLNNGWLLGETACKIHRYILVASLYVSVMSLITVCIERYIAIVHPIRAHMACSRKRILSAMGVVWFIGIVLALPTLLFNVVRVPGKGFPVKLCFQEFPIHHNKFSTALKLADFCCFYLGPVLVQVVLYVIVGKKLFASSETLHRKRTIRQHDGVQKEKDSEAIQARKGVVKMLIATVVVYFLSYAPAQVPLIYNLISDSSFKQNWPWLVFVMTLGYINSAANPILYSIFSQNFRRKFINVLCGFRNGQLNAKRSIQASGSSVGMYSSRGSHILGTQITTAFSEIAQDEKEQSTVPILKKKTNDSKY